MECQEFFLACPDAGGVLAAKLTTSLVRPALAAAAAAGDVKKRYWRLSLLIHPDKCEHPQAHDAFQAVSRAAKELQVGRPR